MPAAGARCAEAYHLLITDELYLAVFNCEKNEAEIRYDLAGHLPAGMLFTAAELWRSEEALMDGTVLTYTVPAEDAALFRITPLVAASETVEKPAAKDQKKDLLSLLVCGAASVGIIAAAAVLYGKRKNDKNPPAKPNR